ncbi:MAG: efflux transporter outer membrane subunit [Sphingomonadales bacterium]|nr:efflux transporter outer membrane subunit [Sphingomonadales bacterium]
MRWHRASVGLLALLACGCGAGAGDVRPPAPATGSSWLEPASTAPVDPVWWRAFGDPELDRLIAMARAGAPDLAVAEARLTEARAERDTAAGAALPQVGASGTASENELSENGEFPIARLPGFSRRFSLFDAGFDASWEVDFWGYQRHRIEAGEARAQAARWNARDVEIALTAELAQDYVDLRAAQARLAAVVAEAEARAALRRLTALRLSAGEDALGSLADARIEEAQAHQARAQTEAQVSAAAYRIAALLGVAPETLVPGLRDTRAPVPVPPATIAMGIRSDLLERRPDVRRAERELAAAVADTAAAHADLFPRISLLGSIGQQAQDAGNLVSPGSTRFSIGPGFSWPIFAGGRMRAQIRAANAREREALARFDAAVTGALSDSEGAANRFAAAARARAEADRAAADATRARKLAEARVLGGEDDRRALETALVTEARATASASDAAAEDARAAVALYKALGGGWSKPSPHR